MGSSADSYNIEKQKEEEQQKNVEAGIKLHKKEQKNKKNELARQIQEALGSGPSQEVIAEVTKKIKSYKIKGFDEENLESVDIEKLEDILSILA